MMAEVIPMPTVPEQYPNSEQERIVRLARLAMLVECEGSITIGMMPPSKTRNRPALYAMVNVTNTATDIIAEAKATLEAEGIGYTARPVRVCAGAGRKWRYDINIHGIGRTFRVLMALMPYLRSKRRQAQLVIEFVESRVAAQPKSAYSSREWKIVTEVRRLNGRMPNRRSLAKAMAYLELPESERKPRATEYFRRYVAMCRELEGHVKQAAAVA